MNRKAAAQAIEDFLRALGHEPAGDLDGTPERVADAWADDLLEGESIDAGAVLREGAVDLGPGERGLVVIRDLSVATVCPHHLMPAHGIALVAYLPGRSVAGIGTIAHVVDVLSRRLTLQESIGENVVELLVCEIGARGAACRIALSHTCLVARGERKSGAVVETLAFAGTFAEPSHDRDVALAILGATPMRGGGAVT